MRYKPGMTRAEKDAYNEYRRDLYRRKCLEAGVPYNPGKPGRPVTNVTELPLPVCATYSDFITARAKQLGMSRDAYMDSLQCKEDIAKRSSSSIQSTQSNDIPSEASALISSVDKTRISELLKDW